MNPPESLMATLRSYRERKDLKLAPCKYLRSTYVALDGTERPFQLRYYQVQMVMHLNAIPRFIVGEDTGLGKCCRKGSFILTNRGFLRVEDIEIWEGMTPNTFKPLSRPLSVMVNGETRPVRSFYYGGKKRIVKIKSRYRYEIGGTKVHPLMVRQDVGEGWVKTSDLRVGDYVCIERKLAPFPSEEPEFPPVDLQGIGANAREFDVPTRLNPDLSRLLGYIVAGGWTSHHSEFSISQCPDLSLYLGEDVRGLLSSQLDYVVPHGHLTTTIDSVFLREYLEVVGVLSATSEAKVVPWCVLQGTQDSVREFLRGYFESNSIVCDDVEVSSASEELLHQVQLLLLRFGIVGKRSPKRIKGNDHTYWRLAIFGDDARLFRDRIGFVSERKSEALALVLAKKPNTNHDVVPHARDIVEALRAEIYSRVGLHGFKGTGIVKQWGVSFFNTLSHVRAGRRNPSYAFLRRMLEVAREVGVSETPAYAAVEAVVDRGFFYDPVVSIEAGEDEVFDLEVDHPEHAFVGNGFVNHNTIECISSLCFLWEKNPSATALVLTKKSAVRQWSAEFTKYTQGVNVVECRGTPKQRDQARELFLNTPEPKVLIMGHNTAAQDFTKIQDWKWGVAIIDEVTVAKTPKTRLHQVLRHISCTNSERAWGLTATLIKNNLLEGYGIYQVIYPVLFPYSLPVFTKNFCITQPMFVGRNKMVDRIVGYSTRHIQNFKDIIDPYYLGRPKHMVASELPPLTTRVVKVGINDAQRKKYKEALDGLLEVGSGEVKEVTMLTAVTYCQEIVNHLELIECDGGSEKLEELVDLISEGDLSGEKVIIFTRFERMVGIGIKALDEVGIKSVRITGRENENQRKESQDIFQDPSSDVKVVWITMAGSDAINLQAAKAIIFYDTPFSGGDYIQVIGRMIRIGSLHDRVFAIHLVAENTVDERVMQIVESKMALIEAVLGQRIKGDDVQEDTVLFEESPLEAVFRRLKQDAESGILYVK